MDQEELTNEAFYSELESAILSQLSDGLRKGFEVETKGNYLKFTPRGYKGSHYEIGLGKEKQELGLHFEGSKDRNESNLQEFRPHIRELEEKLEHHIFAGLHEHEDRRKICMTFSRRPLTDSLVKEYSTLFARFITDTFPYLRRAYEKW